MHACVVVEHSCCRVRCRSRVVAFAYRAVAFACRARADAFAWHAADFGCPPARPRFVCRECSSLRAAWGGSAALRASCTPRFGRVFASRWSRTTGSVFDGCCPSRLIVERLQSSILPLDGFTTFARFFVREDLDQRGSSFFFKIVLHLANLYHLLTAGL